MKAKVIQLNPNKDALTTEKLKTFPGCEGLNEEDATATVFALQTLATILYEYMAENNKNVELKKAA